MSDREWTELRTDPPMAVHEGVVYRVCPVGGWKCARIEAFRFTEEHIADVMDIHVRIAHKAWS